MKRIRSFKHPAAAAALAFSLSLLPAAPAMASFVMWQPTAAQVTVGGTQGGSSINHTFDQSGLTPGYVSGVTTWVNYASLTPLHSSASSTEWFSNSTAANPVNVAEIIYDLGVLAGVGGVAIWNEEQGGVGLINVSFGDAFGNFAATTGPFTILPTNNPLGSSYGATLMGFSSPPNTRYVKLQLSNCPQQNAQFIGCSLGEVAFTVDDTQITSVPEPGSLALAGLGCVAAGTLRRRKTAGLAGQAG